MGLIILLPLLPDDFVLEPLGQFVFGRQFHFFRLGNHCLPNLANAVCQICFRWGQGCQIIAQIACQRRVCPEFGGCKFKNGASQTLEFRVELTKNQSLRQRRRIKR